MLLKLVKQSEPSQNQKSSGSDQDIIDLIAKGVAQAIEPLHQEINTLTSKFKELKHENSTLRFEIKTFKRKIGSLRFEIRTLKTETGTLRTEIKELKQLVDKPEDKILTQTELNAEYFHIRSEALGEKTKHPDFPKIQFKGLANPRFSLKAVQQWAQEQK